MNLVLRTIYCIQQIQWKEDGKRERGGRERDTLYIAGNVMTLHMTVNIISDLPELKFEDFSKLNLSHYSWIHFEVSISVSAPH